MWQVGVTAALLTVMFLACRPHSFIDLIVLLENDLNTVLPEWTMPAAAGSERRRTVWLCGYDERPGSEAGAVRE